MELFMFLRPLNTRRCSFVSRLLLATALWLSASVAFAAESLLDFSDGLKSFRASFAQTVYDADSVVLQESTGTVVLARPGRFKWTYEAPVSQVIVADGLTLWVYDEEIKQVTKQPQSTTLGSAPIGLLSGQRDLASEFSITELGEKDGLEWFQLQPLVSDTDFNEIFIALQGGGLHAMELRDNFDQATQIIFSNFEKNIALDNNLFAFVVPEGVDVVGEGGVPQGQDDLLQDNLQPSSDTDQTDPQDTDQTDPLIAPDPLLIDETAPQVDDNTPLATQSAPSDNTPSGDQPEPIVPADNLSGDQPTIVDNAVPVPAANTDDELLEEVTSEPVVEAPVETAEETVEAEPADDTTNPSREITFEEQRVTE